MTRDQLFELFEVRQTELRAEDNDEAVLVVHGNYRTEHLSEFLNEAMLRFARRVPTVYSLEHRKSIFLPTVDVLNSYLESLSSLVDFAVRDLGVRKLSILAVGEATEIVLAFLARTALQMFECLDKVILINCQYGRFRFSHSLSGEWYQSLLQEMGEPGRLQRLNRLRIVSIQTKRADRLSSPEASQLIFPNGKYLRNYVAIESRYMWNMYLDFQDFEMMDFDASITLLGEFLVLDSATAMTTKNIEYFFLYKEEPHPEPRSIYKQEFTLNCMESLLELYCKAALTQTPRSTTRTSAAST